MQFNSETNNLDLYSEARAWCGIENGDDGSSADTTTFPLKRFARFCNLALDWYTSLIIKAQGWEYDDTNNSATELIDVTTSIVSGTRKYVIAVTWLKIARIRIKDSAGNWIVLRRGDRRLWSTNQLNGASGIPQEYDLLGNWIYLDAAPNWSGSASLEVQHQRGASYFIYTDTTKTPGFATPFHRLVALRAALDYCEINDLDDRAAKLRNKIGSPPTEASTGSGMEKELVDFYSTRDIDNIPSLNTRKEDYGAAGLSDIGPNPPNGFNLIR